MIVAVLMKLMLAFQKEKLVGIGPAWVNDEILAFFRDIDVTTPDKAALLSKYTTPNYSKLDEQ